MWRVHTLSFPVAILLLANINAVKFPFKTVNWAKHPPFHKISLGSGNDGSATAAATAFIDMNATSSNGIAQESQMPLSNEEDYYYDDYYDDDGHNKEEPSFKTEGK